MDYNGRLYFTKSGIFHIRAVYTAASGKTVYSNWTSLYVHYNGASDDEFDIDETVFSDPQLVEADENTVFVIRNSYTGLVGAEPDRIEKSSEPEPVYVYNNGTFDGNGSSPEDYEGKDYVGRVVAHVTIENDVITGITVDFLDDDPEYYVIAQNIVLPRILDAQSPDVDAVSGATRSAEGMIEAVRNALDAARR